MNTNPQLRPWTRNPDHEDVSKKAPPLWPKIILSSLTLLLCYDVILIRLISKLLQLLKLNLLSLVQVLLPIQMHRVLLIRHAVEHWLHIHTSAVIEWVNLRTPRALLSYDLPGEASPWSVKTSPKSAIRCPIVIRWVPCLQKFAIMLLLRVADILLHGVNHSSHVSVT